MADKAAEAVSQIQGLIDIGHTVLDTRKTVKGTIRVDSAIFVKWKSQCENFLSGQIWRDSAYLKNFLTYVGYAEELYVSRGIKILQGIIQDVETGRFQI